MTALRTVTRGGGSSDPSHANIDWLGTTFDPTGLVGTKVVPPELGIGEIVAEVAKAAGGIPIRCDYATHTGGMLGFARRHVLTANTVAGPCAVGSICRDGTAQANYWMLQITARGCNLIKDWGLLRSLLQSLDARITRVDLAVDFRRGEFTVDDAVAMRDRGEFDVRGRRPSSHVAGDWIERKRGRTFYVGKPQNGKLLRVYEKGKQLGDLRSPWVRYEVQIGNRGRTIPLDVLTDPDPYFAGAYPALEKMLPVAARAIPSRKREAVAHLGLKLAHLKRSYGGVLNEALGLVGVDERELLDALRAQSKGAAGSERASGPLHWKEVSAELRRHSSTR